MATKKYFWQLPCDGKIILQQTKKLRTSSFKQTRAKNNRDKDYCRLRDMFVGSAFQFVFSSSNPFFSLESVTLNSCYNTANPRWIGSLPPIDVTDGSKTVFCQLPTSIGPWKPRKWNACEIALKCVNKLILFTGMFEFCRSNCFKERSQWRLESRRSPFFFLFCLFCLLLLFFFY